MIVEPCCAEHQVPRLIRNGNGNALFQTNGDVTIEKLMQAACCLANSGFGEYWICIREVDITLMRSAKRWYDRGWVKRLHLLTATDQTELVATELGDEWMKLTEYGWSEGMQMEMFCVVGETETVVVSGPMLLQASPRQMLSNYSAFTGPVSRLMGREGIVGSLLGIIQSVFRVQKKKAEAEKAKAEAAAPKKRQAKKKSDAEGAKGSGTTAPLGESSGTGSADTSEATDQVSVPSDAPAEG